jgi:hypothetical protein
MSVGDTRTIQALSAAGTSVTGLTWTSSNPNVVSLSTDDPPVLTALAAGHVTIIAGTAPNAASADVTVWVGALPLGTVIWSNPGDGSGVNWIVPAVPSTSGVADVFAFQNDGTVQAITSDGTVAWTANLGQGYSLPESNLPDFQGGLVVPGPNGIYKLDGITGQPYPAYQGSGTFCNIAIHPDGTIFAAQAGDCEGPGNTVVGIDPITGTQKFSVAVPVHGVLPHDAGPGQIIIAGDGYAYFSYGSLLEPPDDLIGEPTTCYSSVLRIDSSGNYDVIPAFAAPCGTWPGGDGHAYVGRASMITNADQGILLTWSVGGISEAPTPQMATITDGGLSLVSPPQLPGGGLVDPVLQAQDGSFVGITGQDCSVGYGGMVSFDAAGNVRWIVPNDCPQIATADGGVIGQSGITYDQYGNATGMIPNMPTYSWTENAYTDGPVDQVMSAVVDVALSFNAFADGSPSPNGTAVKVVRSPMFIPFAIDGPDQDSIFTITQADRADVRAYYEGLVRGLFPTQVALYPLAIEQATAARFFGAIGTTNTIVGYIDHGLDFGDQAVDLSVNDRYRARALCFWTTCLAPAALTTTTTPDGRVWTVGAPNGGRLHILPDGFNPRAAVVFLAACGIDESFITQWHLSNVGQALIVPVYSNTNPQMHLDLGYAANEWKAMLLALAKGRNVQAAVAAGNAVAATQTEHTWQIIGDPLVGFRAQFH